MARWQILLFEFDIIYVNQKTVKWSVIVDFLASRALEDYEPLNFDLPNEDLMYVATTEEYAQKGHHWKLNFDGASNAMGNEIGVVLVSSNKDHYPLINKLDFDCTNNIAKYEACIMGICTATERSINILEVYGDSAIVVYQLKGEWETKDPKFINYQRLDAEEIANDYVLDGEILYKRRKDQVLLRCADAIETKKILKEVHEGVYGTHANGFTMARQIIRFRYYWSTMEGDCINYAKRCHKCQIYGDKIHVPPSPLHVMTFPWSFSMWGMDVIGPISPKALNGHRFIFVVIDYFTKWVEVASYINVTKSAWRQPIKTLKRSWGKWHEKLPFALNAYRTSVRTSTRATPFLSVYGMEAVLPIEVEIPSF
ncbi:RNA-directed DNA polymerase (Reverse transcriptase), Ribonuclease H [Gossypium australe]|uniref:RNA-directed DNA polymerase (Reverse transcriptase), Ribonuclease H n=1 Tax=Gossypium australe TaxID=47621 RepID=A0A5B6WJX4_9ROSI|nr:RNA-directed DNA polymerase (Reverse transcriptase), Ribonuclease H [Gossypium australe]